MDFNILKGKVINNIIRLTNDENDEDALTFECTDGTAYKLYHEQECCESVWLEDVSGNLDDLLNTPILIAELSVTERSTSEGEEAYSYYHLATIKGYVDLRWFGESNGCYSCGVDFVELEGGNL